MIAIILVNWNGWQDTVACVRACLALEGVEVRIVVCDNASNDGSVDQIESWARGSLDVPVDPASPVPLSGERLPQGVAILDRAQAEADDDAGGAELVIVRTGANLGFAGGNNVGMRWALQRGASHCWLLNNDTVVPPDALSKLVLHMQGAPQTGLCGSVMAEYHQPEQLQGYAGAMSMKTFRGRHLGAGMPSSAPLDAMQSDPLRPDEILYPIGASMLASRTFLEEVGLMDEQYFLYYEEADWVLRAGDKFDISIAPASMVYHKVGASAGELAKGMSASSAGFLYRSRLLAAQKWARAGRGRVIVGILEEMLRGLLRGRRGVFNGGLRALSGKVTPPHSTITDGAYR